MSYTNKNFMLGEVIMNDKKVDKGFELRYKNLSYRRRFIRTLWMIPLAILVLCFSYWAGVSIYVLISLTILFAVVGFIQASNNYKLWKKTSKK